MQRVANADVTYEVDRSFIVLNFQIRNRLCAVHTAQYYTLNYNLSLISKRIVDNCYLNCKIILITDIAGFDVSKRIYKIFNRDKSKLQCEGINFFISGNSSSLTNQWN